MLLTETWKISCENDDDRNFARRRRNMKQLSIAEALREGIAEEMRRDRAVFCMGEDIGVPGGWGGAFTVTLGLEQEFPDRILNTPIAELGFFGAAVGAAIMGMRPIVDVQYGDFLFLAMDQIVNNAAKLRYMSGGTINVPLVMRAPIGATGRGRSTPRAWNATSRECLGSRSLRSQPPTTPRGSSSRQCVTTTRC